RKTCEVRGLHLRDRDGDKVRRNPEKWVQRLIATALTIGISKRELFEDYYPGEVIAVLDEWNAIHGDDGPAEEKMDTESFLGSGGEYIG
ncbi:MAG TPA: hypothetical protein PLR69_12220, partial [Candidatus Limiplasma sp.]|nr:hypothetical protein [Candidatus Limiplasma sp.]